MSYLLMTEMLGSDFTYVGMPESGDVGYETALVLQA